MKQLLSGKDWMVSNFLPGEADAPLPIIRRVTAGTLYGGEFIPATVPGDVQSDALDAGVIGEIQAGFSARSAEWTYQRDWLYVKHFTPENHPHKRCVLHFDGVDDACQVFLNGSWLGNHEIPWIPFSFDITQKVNYGQDNCLIVLVKAARDAECQWGYASKVQHLKPRFAYGWDWCMRLVPLGIWKDVYLQYEQESVIEDLYCHADVAYQEKTAVVHAEVSVRTCLENTPLQVTLHHPDGRTDTQTVSANNGTVSVHFSVEDAALWYPNGMGKQPLYEVTAIVGSGQDTRTSTIGLRHIVWKRTEGAGADALAYQPYINGRRVYLQGYNFTPIRQLYGRVQYDVYEKRIAYVKRVGANYLRIWGGGLLEREELYDLCDRNGILLMQELFQSSASGNNHPPRDSAYIAMLTKATRSAVLQKRNHPSLIAWCGGNELCFRGDYMDADGNILIDGVEGMEGLTREVNGHWVPLSPQYPTLAAMETVVKTLDPERQWFHTSGSGPVTQNADLSFVGGDMHDVHGPWTIFGPTDQYTVYNALDMMIHHEFGTQGSASVQTLEAITPPQYLWPLDENNPFVNYHGRMFAGALRLLHPYFGDTITNHRAYALTSRFIQWEQHRYSLESHHRLGAKCAGACLWHLGEPWPNVIENCTIDAYEQVKPAYYGQMAAFRPLHLSAHYDSVIHKERFPVTFALHNSTLNSFTGKLIAQIFALDGTLLEQREAPCFAAADTVEPNAATLEFTPVPESVFFLRQTLLDENSNLLETGYSIHSSLDIPYIPLMTQPVCGIEATLSANQLTLRNTGPAVVSGLTVECGNQCSVTFSDGCLMLLPREKATIQVDFADGKPVPLYLSGFGVPYQTLSL